MKKRIQYISLLLILILSVGQKDIQRLIQRSMDSNLISQNTKNEDSDSDDEAEKKEFEEENEAKRKKNENCFCNNQVANLCFYKISNFTRNYKSFYHSFNFNKSSKKLLYLRFCKLILYN